MKPFEFKLQTSLDLQQHREEEQQKELLARIDEQKQEESVLLSYEHQIVQLFDEIRQSHTSKLNLEELKLQSDYLPVLQEKAKEQQQVVQRCEEAVATSRGELLEIVRGRKVLEKLKVKHHDIYQKEAAREEQMLLDEMATNAFLRKNQQWPQEGKE